MINHKEVSAVIITIIILASSSHSPLPELMTGFEGCILAATHPLRTLSLFLVCKHAIWSKHEWATSVNGLLSLLSA